MIFKKKKSYQRINHEIRKMIREQGILILITIILKERKTIH